ncbi:MFS transporter [Candidatus Heimdallarchaeota archaeon B3_Heim]|nr:MAG: MFS transporter [Candidatus Heimdallarchaeota archaeon B3_Heim]
MAPRTIKSISLREVAILTQNESIKYEIYSYRWIILILFMFVGAMTQIIWITFAPIMNEVASYYNVDSDTILLLAASFMIIYIPVNFPASWLIEKNGLKWGTGIGVILTGVFGFLRAFTGSNFILLMLCQVMVAVGQPFVLNSFTKLAVNWFPQEEKVTATGLGTMALFIGIIIAMFVTSPLYSLMGIEFVLLVYGVFSLISMLLYLLLVKDKPQKPPNEYIRDETIHSKPIKELFRNRDFNLLLVLLFCGLGIFNALLSAIDDIFIRFSPDSGIIGGLLLIGGIFGAFLLSSLSDKLGKRKIFLNIALTISVPLSLLLEFSDIFILTLILAFVFGFILVPALPVGLTYGAEITYPISEEISNGILMMFGQLGGIILLIMPDMILFAFVFGIAAIISLLMKDSDAYPRKSVYSVEA